MIWVYSIQKDEALLAPYFVRHYGSFAEKIVIYDGGSTDGSIDTWKSCDRIEIRTAKGLHQLDDALFGRLTSQCWREANGQTDWVMVVDADEFIYHPSLCVYLEQQKQAGAKILRPFGYNMISDRFIQDPLNQIYEVMPMGVRAPVYAKPVVFRPEADIAWTHGRHDVSKNRGQVVKSELKLLHYRYLNEDYTRRRNTRNWLRVPPQNRKAGFGWTNNPNHKGEHSPEWSGKIASLAFNAVEHPVNWGKTRNK